MSPTRGGLARHYNPAVTAQPKFEKRSRDGALNLASNELHHPGLRPLFQAFVEERVNGLDPSRYPAFEEATSRVCVRLGLKPGSAAIVPGSDPCIRAIVEAFGASGRLVTRVPCYRAYHDYAVAFRLAFHGVVATTAEAAVAALAEKIECASPAVVALVNPDGFSGWCLGLHQVEALAALALRHDSLLVIDEAYAAFAPIDHRPLLDTFENVILLRTFSKSHGAAGLRLALVLAQPQAIDHLLKARIANGLSAVSLAFLDFAFDHAAEFRRLAEDVAIWRGAYENSIRASCAAWTVARSHANFVAADLHCPEAATALARRLADNCVHVRSAAPGEEAQTTIRMTVAPPDCMAPVLELITGIT